MSYYSLPFLSVPYATVPGIVFETTVVTCEVPTPDTNSITTVAFTLSMVVTLGFNPSTRIGPNENPIGPAVMDDASTPGTATPLSSSPKERIFPVTGLLSKASARPSVVVTFTGPTMVVVSGVLSIRSRPEPGSMELPNPIPMA